MRKRYVKDRVADVIRNDAKNDDTVYLSVWEFSVMYATLTEFEYALNAFLKAETEQELRAAKNKASHALFLAKQMNTNFLGLP